MEEYEENTFLGAMSGKHDESCEVAIKAAMEVIGKACRTDKIEVHMGYPKESCRGFLLNTGHILHEGFFGESEQVRLNLINIDTNVFEIKRTAIRNGFICEGRVRYVYLANRGTIDILKLRKKWQELKFMMGDTETYTTKAHLISRLRDHFTYFKVLNIVFKEPIISSDPKFKGTQADVDVSMRITVSGSAEHIVDDFERLEDRVEVMHGRQGESIEQIIKDLHNAYEKGIDIYILIADNGEKVILNVQGVMAEPREDDFDNVLKRYISRVLIHPEEG